MVTMGMRSVLCEICAKAEEHVKHIPQYVLSNEHITLDMFMMKCELKPKKHFHIGRNQKCSPSGGPV
jgi:hypothetical protein